MDLVAACPESQFMMFLNCWWPGWGILGTSYYGREGCDFKIALLGGAVMLLSWFCEVSMWVCEWIGWAGLFSWWFFLLPALVGAVFMLLSLVACLCLIALMIYSQAHTFFCLYTYMNKHKEVFA